MAESTPRSWSETRAPGRLAYQGFLKGRRRGIFFPWAGMILRNFEQSYDFFSAGTNKARQFECKLLSSAPRFFFVFRKDLFKASEVDRSSPDARPRRTGMSSEQILYMSIWVYGVNFQVEVVANPRIPASSLQSDPSSSPSNFLHSRDSFPAIASRESCH